MFGELPQEAHLAMLQLEQIEATYQRNRHENHNVFLRDIHQRLRWHPLLRVRNTIQQGIEENAKDAREQNEGEHIMILEDLVKNKLIHPLKSFPDNTHYLIITGSQTYDISTEKSDYYMYWWCIPPKELFFSHLSSVIPGSDT
jgi:hypothetical protein